MQTTAHSCRGPLTPAAAGHAGWEPGNPDNAGALLTVDLTAIRSNYAQVRRRCGRAACAAVLKADAYGLGAERVAPALAEAGCRHFFVAHLDEAITLRRQVPADAEVFVLHGPPPGTAAAFVAHRVIPVLNSLEQVAEWRGLARQWGTALPAVLQVDTGMARLGLSSAEVDRLADDPHAFDGVALRAVMSHLACADVADHPANPRQRAAFVAARARLPNAPASLAASSGIFLGRDYHFDLVRPGAALFGIAPTAGAINPLNAVVALHGRVVQVRSVGVGTGVGYGHSYTAAAPRRIATVAVGYADGFLRSLSNQGCAVVDGVPLPLIGRVSMDTITLDATPLPDGRLRPGSLVELLGRQRTVDAVAAQAGIIGYEILTSLGARYSRRYVTGDGADPERQPVSSVAPIHR